ncbi:pentatricopeptide repeat-containing protein At1g28690, mitochondrial-like [Cornus florida]|uniref:pentatricopeptide repeat-containing protein At1g28690, mitochondrial-like n=1 Tax=Cornus florida TaxID=4283 RepID=UPI00289C0AFB|nr:pentatricopeptide repeat-containing protein At1g28690, mitochondrial-like [Cornus florida]XP_059653111.1 pentatricopeptide repeat-containing protein At1g28690, mitochondrial-like [Cornus florida]
MIFFSACKGFVSGPLTSRYYTSATKLDPPFSLLQLLQLSIDNQSLKLTQQSHALVYHHGSDQNPFIVTKLISAYSVCKNPVDSRLVFDYVGIKNVYLWNTLINGYAKNCLYNESFDLFNQMCRSEDLPDDFTLSTLSKVSGEIGDLRVGKAIHNKCIRIGVVSDTVVANSLMSMYGKCEDFGGSRQLFDEMPQRNVSSWNVIIAGYAVLQDHNFDEEMWKFVKCMEVEGMRPDAFTVSSLLPLCGANNGKWYYGRELHCYIVKNELALSLGSDVHLGCCLIDMYSRNDKANVGRMVFDRMKCRNVFAWTAMFNGYVQSGASDEALVLFREMQVRDGIEPNRVSLVSILPACSSLAGLMGGKQIHGFAIRKELNHEITLCNALIDMYSKCGSLKCARRVFNDDSICKDAISWSSMISGYGLHGEGQEAIVLFDKMLQLGIKPDMITIVGVLSACGRSGLVNEGLNIYSSVVNDYGIKPTLEICACVVDMLGRSGQLDRALEFIKTMPLQPGPSVWGALVSASLLHGNSEMQDLAYRFLIQIEPENPSNYVSLSNLYASSRRWDVVAEVRTMMKDRGLRKLPGCSWININSKTHSFCVADKGHPCSDIIYKMLDELVLAMKGTGSSSDFEYLT